MKTFYLITTFWISLVISETAPAYGLFIHPTTTEGGCLSTSKDKSVFLGLKDICTPETKANSFWKLEKHNRQGLFFIHSLAGEGETENCLTFANEFKILLQACNPSNPRQYWKFTDDGENTTLSNGENCLSAFVHPKGTTIDFQKCEGADDDTVWQWKVIESQ